MYSDHGDVWYRSLLHQLMKLCCVQEEVSIYFTDLLLGLLLQRGQSSSAADREGDVCLDHGQVVKLGVGGTETC